VLLEKAEGLGALVGFVFWEASDDALLGQAVGVAQGEVEEEGAEEDPEEVDEAGFGVQRELCGEQDQGWKEGGVEGEGEGQSRAAGHAGAGEGNLGATKEEEVGEEDGKGGAADGLDEEVAGVPMEGEEDGEDEAGESGAAKQDPGFGGFGGGAGKDGRLNVDGKNPAGEHVDGEGEAGAESDDQPEEEQRENGVQAGGGERGCEGVAWGCVEGEDAAQRESQAGSGVDGEIGLVAGASGNGLGDEVEDGSLLRVGEQGSIQEGGDLEAVSGAGLGCSFKCALFLSRPS
jgi:hypothetical protein